MFTIPSLRARTPGPIEKKALNYAFLLTPIVSLAAPFITKVAGSHILHACFVVVVVVVVVSFLLDVLYFRQWMTHLLFIY